MIFYRADYVFSIRLLIYIPLNYLVSILKQII